jgi:predicted nucleic acid-binding protein
VPGFLLDTNVISELVRPAPDERVLRWVASRSALDLYLSAVTIGELTRGVTRLPAGQRRDRLARWIEEDLGHIMGEADRQGRPRAALDAQIAATAIRHGLSLVTRNTADFDGIGVQVMNPWDVP